MSVMGGFHDWIDLGLAKLTPAGPRGPVTGAVGLTQGEWFGVGATAFVGLLAIGAAIGSRRGKEREGWELACSEEFDPEGFGLSPSGPSGRAGGALAPYPYETMRPYRAGARFGQRVGRVWYKGRGHLPGCTLEGELDPRQLATEQIESVKSISHRPETEQGYVTAEFTSPGGKEKKGLEMRNVARAAKGLPPLGDPRQLCGTPVPSILDMMTFLAAKDPVRARQAEKVIAPLAGRPEKVAREPALMPIPQRPRSLPPEAEWHPEVDLTKEAVVRELFSLYHAAKTDIAEQAKETRARAKKPPVMKRQGNPSLEGKVRDDSGGAGQTWARKMNK